MVNFKWNPIQPGWIMQQLRAIEGLLSLNKIDAAKTMLFHLMRSHEDHIMMAKKLDEIKEKYTNAEDKQKIMDEYSQWNPESKEDNFYNDILKELESDEFDKIKRPNEALLKEFGW